MSVSMRLNSPKYLASAIIDGNDAILISKFQIIGSSEPSKFHG